ncbi:MULTISPECIES: heme-binding protein [Massilia]|jgi:uncharacterized protein GlcG (DUF336 family)|uniref:GlcG/HbpS family heme-binding protein n=1 Tax=Massilia TaxID=149698 RepID=UPI00235467FB|nr:MULTISPECIES: heme-binding protein [Massilia]MDN4038933.1 heme-binding protein [Massilia sp. YIM B02443]
MRLRILGGVLLLALNAGSAAAQAPAPATYTVTLMSPELALRMAQAALAACRQAGYQVAVAVADRGGQVQVVLRDRLAGSHTVDAAADKAWTAASFKMGTTALALSTKEGAEASGIRHIRRVLAVGGGIPVEANGALVGAIGVSGAPGGAADDTCARAGIAAVAEDLNF